MDKIYGMDGRMDKPVTICFPFGEHKNTIVRAVDRWASGDPIRSTIHV